MFLIFGRSLNDWGYILDFLDENDARPAREQFAERYMGGWMPVHGVKFDRESLTMTYPGDPPFTPISAIVFRRELLVLFMSDFVGIMQPDGSFECARMS